MCEATPSETAAPGSLEGPLVDLQQTEHVLPARAAKVCFTSAENLSLDSTVTPSCAP